MNVHIYWQRERERETCWNCTSNFGPGPLYQCGFIMPSSQIQGLANLWDCLHGIFHWRMFRQDEGLWHQGEFCCRFESEPNFGGKNPLLLNQLFCLFCVFCHFRNMLVVLTGIGHSLRNSGCHFDAFGAWRYSYQRLTAPSKVMVRYPVCGSCYCWLWARLVQRWRITGKHCRCRKHQPNLQDHPMFVAAMRYQFDRCAPLLWDASSLRI